ncbi:MAG: glycosyltransferase family 4 protein [Bacteroidota bacterium]
MITVFVIGPRGFPNVQGGIERFSEGFYPLLVKKGYVVVCFVLSKYSFRKEWMGVKFIRVPSIGSKFFEKPLYNFFATLYCIAKRPDIVHVHSVASGMFIFLLKLFRLKIVARYNSMDYLHNKWNFIGKAILKNSERQFFLADYIITNNKSFLFHFKEKGRKNNLSYIPNGVEIFDKEKYIQNFNSTISNGLERKKYILYVGRITPEKNIASLIEAFLQIEDKKLKLVIAGDAAHNDNYFSLLKRKYSDERILFIGKVERENLNSFYANCGLFVIPSFTEGTPNVLLEAMSFNCPILASRIPAHLEFRFDNDSYFFPNDIEELKQKMIQKLSFAENPNYTSSLSAHQWPQIVERIHNIHEKLLTPR